MFSKTYEVSVPDVGAFTFRKRQIKDQLRIEAEAVRTLGGPTEDGELRSIALTLATLQVLTVTAPAGWDLEALDPLEKADMDRLYAVHRELRAAEDRFRGGSAA